MTTITPAVLRPKQAAAYIQMSIPSFWRLAKNDPNFPRPFKLSENSTAIFRKDLDDWLAAKKELVK